MSNEYIKELEEQIEALQLSLDRERDWNDFMDNRKLSQKYRRWCLKRYIKIPQATSDMIFLDSGFCYEETVFHCLQDMRDYARNRLDYILSDAMDIHRDTLLNGDKEKIIDHVIVVELFNQRKDKAVFIMECVVSQLVKKKKKTRLKDSTPIPSDDIILEVNGITPIKSMHELDEVFLGLKINEDSTYYKNFMKISQNIQLTLR
jgi:hypothetical protein